ncbi:peptidase S66, LD-carboxypeptidase A [Aspergillus heteromorphus CBS 117.55]|uniref:Peptidase S66, LD-carboxypeptidase A n=1 Tax=Aspergillus heteromorphus CBS 117.55 TaxID=1448321 RepID=A0A317VIX1_9EURO|nr:peptidase S66, LD-carboxypeptidase A [Aspergillus heteromorphus CBS 117.55]PWY72978.1 peptidase S66, LD-carboxypeptidase A [Aspergillus heteromorphus CBS 117.55]
MPATILPKALRKGDTIAFISPSARLNHLFPIALERATAVFESLGFQVKIIYSTLPKDVSFKESVKVRCEELHSAFRDPAIAAIICTIGGAHCGEMLPHLDYDLIRSNPKIFVGYSDTTFLHYAIESRTGLRTFYGPSILTDWSDLPNPVSFTVDHFLHVLAGTGGAVGALPRSSVYTTAHSDFMLTSDASTKPRELTDAPAWRWLQNGCATGRLYGGVVSCVVRLQGTLYAPKSWKNKIMFLECSMGDDMVSPYLVSRFRSALMDLALSDAFHDISGLVIGRCYKYDAQMQDELADVILGVFETLVGRSDLPILMNVDFGHTSPLLTLPIGASVRLDSENDEFVVLEAGVEA